MSTAVLSATVAAAAVLVSAIAQYFTLRRSRENVLLTATTTSQTARISALSSAVQLWEQGLREDLAEFVPMTYILDGLHRAAMAANEPWPGKSEPELRKAEVLYHRIVLRLDPSIEPQRALVETLDALRNQRAKPWLGRRDAAVDAAVKVFRARWSDVIEHQT